MVKKSSVLFDKHSLNSYTKTCQGDGSDKVVIIMLNVKTPEEVNEIIKSLMTCSIRESFKCENIKAVNALGRILHQDIIAQENVPGFNRSTVDGYAVLSSDTFGCSEGLPSVLKLTGEVLMGESADEPVKSGFCVIVSTGGEVPDGADAVVMHEFTEDYGSGLIGMQKPVAPGANIIFKNDDAAKGDVILKSGLKITPHDIGILSALGYINVDVRCKPVAGVISTGDELVAAGAVPKNGQVRDVNLPMLCAALHKFGADVKDFGIMKDEEALIHAAMMEAVRVCDFVLISGGSSAGTRDMTAKIIESEGEILLHGIAMKPGKPTILGVVKEKPVFGLPGHPVAAYMVTELFVRPLISGLTGAEDKRKTTKATLSEAISSNHGREEYIVVRLDEKGETAAPVKGKSGLISGLSEVDGYICVPRDCEGLAKGEEVVVIYF